MYQKQGFTLIELLVVVLIIGILAAVALSQYEKAVLKSRYVNAELALNNLYKALQIYYMANGTYPTRLDELDIEMPGDVTNGNTVVRPNAYYCVLATGVENMSDSVQCWLHGTNHNMGIRWYYQREGFYCFALKSDAKANDFCRTRGTFDFANNSHNFYLMK